MKCAIKRTLIAGLLTLTIPYSIACGIWVLLMITENGLF